jgi:hypothetical protein
MGIIEKKIIGLLFACIPLSLYSQRPDHIKASIDRMDRSVYLLDEVLDYDKAEVMSRVQPEDSALVRAILDNGKKESDYLGFFKRMGYRIKKIKLEAFEKLPKDSISYSPAEKRLLSEYRNLERKDDSLMSLGQNSDSLTLQMGSRRYWKVVRKQQSAFPLLIGVYAIYRYEKYTLVVYYADVHWREVGINYQIYSSLPGD